MNFLLAILLQPLSANDIVAIEAVTFGGIAFIIRTLRPSQTPADAKLDTMGDQISGIQDVMKTLIEGVQRVSLAVTPPATAAGKSTPSTPSTPPATPMPKGPTP